MTIAYLDRLATQYVRLREGDQCQHCHMWCYGESSHCAHIRPREHRMTRWLPSNLLLLCFGCHRHFTDNPGQFKAWLCINMGSEEYNELIRLSNQVWDKDMESRAKVLKEEIRKYEI